VKIALIQMNSQPDRRRNIKQALELMEEAVALEHPDLVVLPEHFDWTGGTAADKRHAADRVPGGDAYFMVQQFAARHRVWVHAGSLLEQSGDGARIYNTTVVFDSNGREAGVYRKIHLFDITAPDGKIYAESATVAPGNQLLIYELKGFRVACAICYDLRFSRLFDRLAREGVDVFILPAAFTEQTGKDHWEVLCRARAIEFQAYVAACGQCGSYPAPGGEERRTFGHSLICDPWGDIIARAASEVTVLTAVLDASRLKEARQWIPMRDHRVELSNVDVQIAASR
jgi:deaminated glutathione amidase